MVDKTKKVIGALANRNKIGEGKKDVKPSDIVKKVSDKRQEAKDSSNSPTSALPADLAKAQATPGTSTSTGGATATRNTGAATGGAVTVTISGSSSTGTSTETSTETQTTGSGKSGGKGAGKGAAKGASTGKVPGKELDTGDKRPHIFNITVNSTGQSGHAVDGGAVPPVKVADAKKKILKAEIKKSKSK